MLGLTTGTEIRFAIYAFALAALASIVLYGKYEKERADGIVAKDQAARSAQDARDLQLAQGTIDELRKRIGDLTAPGVAPVATSTPPPRIRVCVPTGNVRPEVAASESQPIQPANEGGAGSVLSVDSGGLGGESPDIGPGLQDLARAGVLLATYRAQLWEWSVKQAQPAK